MTRVTDYAKLSARLGQLLFAGGVTNGLPKSEAIRQEIAAGTLFREDLPGGILLLRQREDFLRLNFMLPDPAALLSWIPPQSTGLELPWRDRDPGLRELGEGLIERGWTPLVRRIRVTRKAGLPEGDPGADSAVDFDPPPEEVLQILARCYSPISGCLPVAEELAGESAMTLPGAVLHYRSQGNTTEMRHLAVLPEARGQGLAKRLISVFLHREGDKLSRLWMDRENKRLLRLYESFGYHPDGWNSTVLYYLKA